MRIVEIFPSKQGEGLWTGVESVFVRTVGCHLRCRYCDTPYAFWESGEGEDLCVEEIAGRVMLLEKRHVVITGGEPMLHAELVPLTKLLKALGVTITVETSGTLDLPVICDLVSISPKLSNSTPSKDVEKILVRRHEANRDKSDVVRKLISRYDYQLKFVVDTKHDLAEIESYIAGFEKLIKNRVLLMPQGTEQEMLRKKEEWIVPYCREKGYTFCPRMQIQWYGDKRGT